MSLQKKYALIFFSFALFIIGVIIFFIYQHNISKEKAGTDLPVETQSKSIRVQTRGLQLTGYDNEEKVISIKADKFTIRKMKIGFLTTSLFNVAELKNAVIDIYGKEYIIHKAAGLKSK